MKMYCFPLSYTSSSDFSLVILPTSHGANFSPTHTWNNYSSPLWSSSKVIFESSVEKGLGLLWKKNMEKKKQRTIKKKWCAKLNKCRKKVGPGHDIKYVWTRKITAQNVISKQEQQFILQYEHHGRRRPRSL